MGGADGVFFGFDLEHVLRHRREDGLLLVPTMGERLGAAGKTMRVYCANSKGSTRLQHLYADRYPDHVCACVHDLVTSVPDNERRELVCPRCRLAFEVRHDIPVMLRNAARSLSDNEARHYSERSAALDPK